MQYCTLLLMQKIGEVTNCFCFVKKATCRKCPQIKESLQQVQPLSLSEPSTLNTMTLNDGTNFSPRPRRHASPIELQL